MGVLTAGGGLRVAGITPDNAAGKRVLVTAGASGMGVMALKIARAWGAETLATTRGEAKRAALSDLADHVLVCPEASALPDLVKQAGEGEKGIDAAFDPIGGDHVPAMIQAANPLAKLVVYERLGGAESTLHLASLMIKDVSLVGFTLFRLMREPALLQEVVRDALARAGDLRPIVAGSFPFDEAPEALRTLGQSAHLGKLVIDVG